MKENDVIEAEITAITDLIVDVMILKGSAPMLMKRKDVRIYHRGEIVDPGVK